jgi:predicted TIM-barrel fold metal-dependent hydrolase
MISAALSIAGSLALAAAAEAPVAPALTPYIDAHAHFDERDIPGSIRSALAALGRQNAQLIILMTPPDTFDSPGHYDAEIILAAAREHPGKLAVVGGGGTLNAMIQQAVASGAAGEELRKRFQERADELIRGGVVGFGEITAEHFAGGTPYQQAPADHPLLLLLADIAAEHGMPIDLHMEAVPQAMPLPAGLKSPPNAPQLGENIAAFERLLAHNRRAKVIWAHAGADGTGYRTPDLCRRLLKAHSNLYMEIKTDPQHPGRSYPLVDGRIKPDWLQLLQDFPDRFVIGSDQHYPEPSGKQRWQESVLLLNQLPAGLRRKVGRENVLHLYRMAP